MADVCSLCCNTRADAQLNMIQDDEHKGHKSSPLHQLKHWPYDIFLSHSGAQKGFVKDLYQELTRSTFSTLLGIEHHSSPLGDHFPSRIFQAAKSCRVALVVLSEEFLCSKWPMVELCTFVDAMAGSSGGLRLLPLFFKLSPADLKCEGNLKRWRKSWRAHAEQDGLHSLNVSKWEDAVEKLRSQNGILFEQRSEGELTYIEKILSAVSQIVPPAITFDTTFVAGKARLCQVILDKLESMDHHQSSRVMVSSVESASASTSSHRRAPCVLGLYGLPGSGKSTLCKCLVDHFRPLFGSTNTLYMEFSSTLSDDAEVVNKLMELRHLTNFRDRARMDRASELENVESLLKSCRLSSCKVFLVVDNISDKTLEAVQRILHLGFGHGSKIILVAHTLEVLRKTLDSLKHRLHWACDSMVIPGIDEMEASEILLQTARGSYGAASDKLTLLKSLTSRQMGTVKRIVHMCRSDDSEHGQVWLPLVMKAVGTRLLKYDKNDLEGWESDLQSFWTRIRTYEQSAVIEELLGDNFKALPDERRQVLFLDVALFILHLENEIDGVSDALSMMHGISRSRIKMLIQDLERRGFLIVSEVGIIRVHDLYLKFARSIQDGPSKYISTPISWCWKECQIADTELGGNSLLLKEDQSWEDKGKLRALVLEVGESFERVDLQGFSGLKAVLLRNCKSVAVLGLAGLGSLRILEVRNCASFGRVECSDSDYSSLLNINRFSVKAESIKALAEVDQERSRQLVSYFVQLVNAVKRVMMAPFRQPHSLGVGFNITSKMRSLQVVHLENTSIGRLECVGGMWPQLRDLTVIEQHLERFELGCLPKLEQFLFRDVGQLQEDPKLLKWRYMFDLPVPEHFGDVIGAFHLDGKVPDRSSEIWRRKEGDARYLLAGQDLLLGCPQLKRVRMQSCFFKQGRLGPLPVGVVSLELLYVYTATELPDLSLSAHTLEDLHVLRCEKLERVNLGAGFKSLTTLRLSLCHNIVEVNGLGSLPSLRVLQVTDCRKVRVLKGFENSEMLEELILVGLSELREISCFSSLRESLCKFRLVGCPKLTTASVARADHLCDLGKLKAHLCDMEKLRQCAVSIDGECCFNLSNCKSLRFFYVYICHYVNGGVLLKLEGLDKLEKFGVRISLEPSEEADSNERSREHFDRIDDPNRAAAKCGLASMVRLGKGSISFDLSLLVPLLRSNPQDRRPGVWLEILPGGFLYSMNVWHCHVLDSLEGIGQCLASTLEVCYFTHLCNLRSLRGVESLTQLRRLHVSKCPVLGEVPSLHALVHLEMLIIEDCPKVKAVEGCDYMTQLWHARFSECESMERLPVFSSLDKLRELYFGGCKFASDVEKMAAWVKDESAPIILRAAALDAVLVQYYSPHADKKEKKEPVAELLWWSMVRWMPPYNNGWLDFSWLEHVWINKNLYRFSTEAPLLRAAVRELDHRLTGRGLLFQSHLHGSSIIHFLDDPHVTMIRCWGLSYAMLDPLGCIQSVHECVGR